MEISNEEWYRDVHPVAKLIPISIEVDSEKCIKCKRCVSNCPGGIYWDEKRKMPVLGGYGLQPVTDLACNACVAACESGAIKMVGKYYIPNGRYKTLLANNGELVPPNPFGDKVPRLYEEIEKDLTEVEKVIYTRRSNRIFRDKPVPKELINRILEAGRFAPSAGNGQPWKFIVVTNKNLIKEIDSICLNFLSFMSWLYLGGKDISGKYTPWRNLVISLFSYAMPGEVDPRPMGAIKKAIELHKESGDLHFDAPVVIYVLKDKRGIGNPDFDAGIAAQNIVLAAHSLGLGTCYVSFGTIPFAFLTDLNKKLGITYPWEVVTSIAIGYPKGKIDKAVPRGVPPVEWIE